MTPVSLKIKVETDLCKSSMKFLIPATDLVRGIERGLSEGLSLFEVVRPAAKNNPIVITVRPQEWVSHLLDEYQRAVA